MVYFPNVGLLGHFTQCIWWLLTLCELLASCAGLVAELLFEYLILDCSVAVMSLTSAALVWLLYPT